ncbi:response regulator receiver protein [Mycobacterium asiaticum]|uniref:Response regulator receiver protein n=1 Tax=Mycobacterium asiaticum TaxID=1790 RepID=A0A1A3UQ93_MYCAS|nr:response regulator receiver protein [Mycobacterium asiaticum]OBK97011.1 response regulator receiver protein [Mycobacterium asiaticum]
MEHGAPSGVLKGRLVNQDISLLHQQIADLARDLHNRPGTDSEVVIDQLIAEAAHTIPGAQYAGLTVATRHGQISTQASTHQWPRWLDQIQQRYQEGPCLIAAWEHHTVRVDDLVADARWPRYRHAALAETPIRSILSFELFTSTHTLGALNVYAEVPHAFDDEAVEIGFVFATHAALVWDSVQRERNFQSALASRDIIGQAKGMLMHQFDIDAVRAFELLKRLSQESNTPLVNIARAVVELRRQIAET